MRQIGFIKIGAISVGRADDDHLVIDGFPGTRGVVLDLTTASDLYLALQLMDMSIERKATDGGHRL